jgi:molecular chaperone HscA
MGRIAINIATGSLQQQEMIVGIDLGTTNSLVAIIHPGTGQPQALKEVDEVSLVPSVIYFDEANQPVVGTAAKEHLVTDPSRTIFSVKRLLGKTYQELGVHASAFGYRIIAGEGQSMVKVQVGNTFYSPIDLSAYILEELKKRAEHILKTPVQKAVITVPAYFNDAQRQATRDAGKLAGLDVLRIINEPTAASLAYGIGLTKEEEKTIAVYDLGGGTFDISILRLSGGIFEVLSTYGDTYLGGDDIDQAIILHWKERYSGLADGLVNDASLQQEIRLKAEEAKISLSTAGTYEGKAKQHSLHLTLETFNDLVAPLVQRTLDCCARALKDASLTANEIDTIVMVGGSTRVPLVKQSVTEFFGKPVNDTVNPDEVVALGAAIQADILAGNNKQLLLLDITPLSLGIETSGGLMDVLIPRNAKIPAKAARQYTTQVDGQPSMRISVYQGERDLVADNRKLAEFNLTGIPGMPAGLPKVEVGFLINADGILTVSARELRSGVEQQIEVKPQSGLADEDVEKMLLDSMTHARDDIRARALAEAKAEGEQLLLTTERFIQKNASLLTPAEISGTAAAMQALQLAITMDDKDLVQQKIEELNDFSRPYAERVMDEAISAAMKGRSI